MQKFKLEIWFRIVGIGSASGLIFSDQTLYVISDNAGYLYQYHTESRILDRIPAVLSENPENIAKALKPDFEAVVKYQNSIYLFGSGSTDARQILYTVNLTNKAVQKIDLSALYDRMRSVSLIDIEDFNIEGAAFHNAKWYLFQRGNGAKGENGIFIIDGKIATDSPIAYQSVTLPKINGISSGFTDAVVHGDHFYFLASAEDTPSTYEDGDVAGSAIGKMSIADFKVERFLEISDSVKFEGITFYQNTDDKITFLLCEDNDSDILESAIYKIDLDD